MEGLPVIEDLVAIVHDVRRRAHVTQETECHQRQQPVEASAVVVPSAQLAGLVVLGVAI